MRKCFGRLVRAFRDRWTKREPLTDRKVSETELLSKQTIAAALKHGLTHSYLAANKGVLRVKSYRVEFTPENNKRSLLGFFDILAADNRAWDCFVAAEQRGIIILVDDAGNSEKHQFSKPVKLNVNHTGKPE